MAPGRGGLQAPSLGAEGWSSSRTANRDCISAPLVNAGRGDLVLVPEPRMTGASRGSSLVTEAQLNYGDPGQTKEVTTVLPGGMVPFSVANRPPVISRGISFRSRSGDGPPAHPGPCHGGAVDLRQSGPDRGGNGRTARGHGTVPRHKLSPRHLTEYLVWVDVGRWHPGVPPTPQRASRPLHPPNPNPPATLRF